MNEKNSFENYSLRRTLDFVYVKKRQKITFLCRLSKAERDNNQESIFIIQYKRTSRQPLGREMIYQIKSARSVQSDQNESKKRMKDSFSNQI